MTFDTLGDILSVSNEREVYEVKNEQEIVRSVFDAYIREAKAISTKKDRPTFDMLEEVKNMAIKALEQPTQRWIPVSERLPENEGLYIVSVKNDHQRQYSKTCWFSKPENWFARQDIIAWQPLPQPYKEK